MGWGKDLSIIELLCVLIFRENGHRSDMKLCINLEKFSECWAWAIGDGVCDDANNIEPCDFDGLDCCGEISSYQFNFCVFCDCHLET